MLGETGMGQHSLYTWAIGHRIHHKYSETDADPHTTTRRFLYAHIGWLLKMEHPDVQMKERMHDFSDLERDPVVMFQHKYCMIIFRFSFSFHESFSPQQVLPPLVHPDVGDRSGRMSDAVCW